MNLHKPAKLILDQTVCEVHCPHKGDLRLVAKFYAYKGNKQTRHEEVWAMADAFIIAMAKPTLVFKLRQRVAALVRAVHRGAVRWNEGRTTGYKLAGLLALATDALLHPGAYPSKQGGNNAHK